VRTSLTAALIALVVAAPATAAPTLSRNPADPGQLVLNAPSSPGQAQYYRVAMGPTLVFESNPDFAPTTERWTITAPDCVQDPVVVQITCSAPVTSLAATMGEGDDGLDTLHLDFPILVVMGGGRDFVGGGLAGDLLNMGPGADGVKGDKGGDVILGGADDDDLFGGPGDDLLNGDVGSDKLLGEGGRDRILARDGQADARVDCGKGDNAKERAKVDLGLDPRPRSC
jgi:Ca2+-binding RTX toxin-like protein